MEFEEDVKSTVTHTKIMVEFKEDISEEQKKGEESCKDAKEIDGDI